MKLLSWNVNGLRANLKKGFTDWLTAEQADVVCVQESRVTMDDLAPLLKESIPWAGYELHLHPAGQKGYSGTAIFTRHTPLSVTRGMGVPVHDGEGRIITAEFPEFYLVNVYVPNSQRELTRLAYRQEWDRDFLSYLKTLEKQKPVVCCGDFNVAHCEIDLARPKDNRKTHGFTPEERAGFDAMVKAGFVDTFRSMEPGPGHYTWWSQMNQARARNVGWRIDYFLISEVLRPKLRSAFIRNTVMGSDHCPVGIEFNF